MLMSRLIRNITINCSFEILLSSYSFASLPSLLDNSLRPSSDEYKIRATLEGDAALPPVIHCEAPLAHSALIKDDLGHHWPLSNRHLQFLA